MEYLFTERAHLMCPNMCFGIVTAVRSPFDEARIAESLDALAQAHPFLCSLLGCDAEKNAFYYSTTDKSQIQLFLKEERISGAYDAKVMEEFERITRRDFNLFSEGMLKVSAWSAGNQTVFLLVFHHLLADGRGALELAAELADCYVSEKKPAFAPERLIRSEADMPAASRLPPVSRLLVNRANARWKKEGRQLSYEEYHAFAEAFLRSDPVKHELSVTGADELHKIAAVCRQNGVTVNDWLLARCFTEDATSKVVMACDLRERLPFYNKGALGNYSTAFSIEIRKKSGDVFALAKQVRAAVQKKMGDPAALYLVLQCYAALEPGLLDAAFTAARDGFESRAAKFIGTGFFGFGESTGYSVTNLGRTESAVMEAAYFIPPASPAMKKTYGVLTLNGIMTVCTARR